MKTTDALTGALPIIAKMLGRKLGVRVEIGGNGAYTDGRTIHLPSLPADDKALAILANGYIDHEAAHIRYTDFALEKPPGLAGPLTNLLEDIRIERALGVAYPGTKVNLARLVAHLEQQAPSLPDADAPIGAQVLAALYCQLRSQVLGQPALATAGATLERRIREALPAGVVIKLLALAHEVRRCRSTAEARALALRIKAMLEEQVRDDPPPPDEGSSQDQGEASSGSAAQSDAAGGSPADASSGSDDRSDANAPAQADDPATGPNPSVTGASHAPDPVSGPDARPDGEPTSGADARGDRDSAPAPGSAGADDNARRAALKTLLAAGDDGARAPDPGAQAQALLDAAARRSPEHRVVMAEYDAVPANVDPGARCREARAATAQLRRRLAALVQAHRADERWRSRRGRRLEARALYRLRFDDPAVFARVHEHEAPDTAIALLLDRSSSMRGTIPLAAQATLATALALEDIDGVRVRAVAFPGSRGDRLIPLKGFDERASRVAGRFRIDAGGGTPLDNALWRAGFELCRRPEPRRLLIVATDGQPDDADACRQVIARCRAGGIEVLGLGIGLSLAHVQHVFGAREATAIRAIHELAPALFRVLEQRLVVRTA